jgi:hypothetical protein
MCRFITAFLPGSADLSAAAATFDRHHLGFTKIDNPHVLAQVLPSEVFLLTTRSHCDCGTALGSQARSHPDDLRAMDQQCGKFRKRGWSEAKILRWQEQKHMSEEKLLRAEEAHALSATP